MNDSRLWNTVLRMSEQLEKQYAEQRLLAGLTQRIGAGDLAGPVLDYLYESCREFVPCDRIGVALLSDDGQHLVSRWVRTEAEAAEVRIAAGYSAPLAGSSLQRVIEQGTPRLINDLDQYLRENPLSESTHRIVQEGMRSSLTCPLVAVGRPVGVVFFSSRKPDTYTPDHITAFEQIAGQLAVVVEKTRLYQELVNARARETALVLAMLPEPIAARHFESGEAVADCHPHAAVLVARLKGVTQLLAERDAASVMEVVNLLADDFHELARHAGATAGTLSAERWIAAAGLGGGGGGTDAGATAGGAGAVAVLAELAKRLSRALEHRLRENGLDGLRLHIGLDCGPLVAAVISRRLRPAYDYVGECVDRADAISSLELAAAIRATRTVRDRLPQSVTATELGADRGEPLFGLVLP